MLDFFRKNSFKKFFITIGILALYKIAMMIMIPGIDMDSLPQLSSKSGFLDTLNVFSGGSIDNCSILATNIMPYITATIITQMLCSKSIGIEYFQNLKKDKEIGDMKKHEWTQYFTVIVAFINACYISKVLCNNVQNGVNTVYTSNGLFYLIAIPAMIAGSLFCVWIANRISKSGIGQGVSVLIFANIVSNSASSFKKIYDLYVNSVISFNYLLAIVIFFLSLFFIIIYVEACVVYFPTRYTGVVGKNIDQKLPLKINNSGVMPAILASSLAHVPTMIIGFLEFLNFQTATLNKYASIISSNGSLYYIFNAVLIFTFTTTQSEITFDPEEIAYSLKESGAVIKDVRPGEDTKNLLEKVLSKLNFISGIYLVFVCVLSEYFCNYFNQVIGEKVLQLSGTSVLILVSTAKLVFEGIRNYNYKEIIQKMITTK